MKGNGGLKKNTYAGHPMNTARTAKIVFPLPYPSDWNIAGAKSGKPNPAHDRRKVAAASASKFMNSLSKKG